MTTHAFHARGPSASAARAVADSAIAGWNAIADALVPVIGLSALTALYRRCLAAVRLDRAWLPAAAAGDLPDDDWVHLHAALSRQTAEDASDACASLFVAFGGLLATLIGHSLTDQLLHSVSAFPSTVSAAQDTVP